MTKTIYILLVEDSVNDAELILAELRRAGFEPKWERVETEPDFLAGIKKSPDLIISDYALPQFSGLRAAEILKESGLNIPFILISGTAGEDAAVEAMRRGAADYLLKDRLVRLGSAVERALREVKERRGTEDRAHQSREEFKDLFDNAPVGFHEVDAEGRLIHINKTELKMLGYSTEELLGQFVWKISADEETSRRAVMAKLGGEPPPPHGFERRFRRKDGSTFPVLINDRLLKGPDGTVTGIRAAIQDITERKQTEAALNREQDLSRALLNNSPDKIYFKDAQSRFVKCSQAMAAQFGVGSPEALAGKTDFDFFKGQHARPAFEDEQRIIRTGQPIINKEECEVWTDGHVTWVSSTKLPWLDDTGKIIGIMGISRDITEHKRAEEALRESEALYYSLVDQMPAGIFRKDAEGRYVFVNSWFCQLKGTTPEAILGKKSGELAREYELSKPHPDNLTNALEIKLAIQGEDHHQMIMQTGRPVEVEEEYPGPDGTRRLMHVIKIPISDAMGMVVGSQGMLFDITERRRAEEEVRWKTAFLEAQVDSALDGILVVDSQNKRILQNHRLIDLFHVPKEIAEDADDNKLLRHVTDQIKNPMPFLERVKHLYEHPDEISRDEIELTDGTMLDRYSSPIRDKAGKYYGRIWAFRDITERRKLEEQFRQSQKMEAVGQLAGGVAHDFNNILAVIQMQADLLKTDGDPTPSQLEFANDIVAATQRAANLTRQLLTFSRKEMLQPRDLDLNESINDLTKMLRRTLGENIQLQFKFAMQSLLIHADAGMMDQVLMNLAVNARDAMPGGGQLVIETSAVEFDGSVRMQSAKARPGSFVCLSVSDTGCGISAGNMARIFEPFFTTKEVGKGTGLGLATVFGIIQQHQGWINVDSEVGRGATFRIYLPRLSRASEQKAAPTAPASARRGSETILLVEDDVFLRASVRKVLSQLGYRVLEAVNGAEALEIWKEKRAEIHLVLTDLVMPGGINGKELGEQLLKESPKLKLIYTSGYSAEVAGKDFTLEEGVNFLIKPFQMQKLAQTVRHKLDANSA